MDARGLSCERMKNRAKLSIKTFQEFGDIDPKALNIPLYSFYLIESVQTMTILAHMRYKLKITEMIHYADYDRYTTFGSVIPFELFMQYAVPYYPTYEYYIYIFRDEETLHLYKSRASVFAKKDIYKLMQREREPYQPDIHRDPDMYIKYDNGFKPGIAYQGTWYDLDMHSAEPYFLCGVLREMDENKLAEKIEEVYRLRGAASGKTNSFLKRRLVCYNGHMRNLYPSIYKEVCRRLYDCVNQVYAFIEEVSEGSVKLFSMRRDGLIFYDKEGNFDIESHFDIGEGIGQWSIKKGKGALMPTGVAANYRSTIKSIPSKEMGIEKVSLRSFIYHNLNAAFVRKGKMPCIVIAGNPEYWKSEQAEIDLRRYPDRDQALLNIIKKIGVYEE